MKRKIGTRPPPRIGLLRRKKNMATIKEVLESEIEKIKEMLENESDSRTLFDRIHEDVVNISKAAVVSSKSVDDNEKKVGILIQGLQNILDSIGEQKQDHKHNILILNAKLQVLQKLLGEDNVRKTKEIENDILA